MNSLGGKKLPGRSIQDKSRELAQCPWLAQISGPAWISPLSSSVRASWINQGCLGHLWSFMWGRVRAGMVREGPAMLEMCWVPKQRGWDVELEIGGMKRAKIPWKSSLGMWEVSVPMEWAWNWVRSFPTQIIP